jgi:hypothetical protein
MAALDGTYDTRYMMSMSGGIGIAFDMMRLG